MHPMLHSCVSRSIADATEAAHNALDMGDFAGGGLHLAYGIACALVEAQRSGLGQVIDAAMVEAAELMADMLKARKDIGLSAVVGDRASAKLVEALAALSEARSAMVDMHGELNDVKLRIGVRTKMVGWEDKPPELATLKANADLRQVS